MKTSLDLRQLSDLNHNKLNYVEVYVCVCVFALLTAACLYFRRRFGYFLQNVDQGWNGDGAVHRTPHLARTH